MMPSVHPKFFFEIRIDVSQLNCLRKMLMLVDFDILKFVRLDLNPGNRQKYGKIKKS